MSRAARTLLSRPLGLALTGALALTLAAAVAGPAVQADPAPRTAREHGSLTDLTAIQDLSKAAYIWGLPAEFMYRFGKYNALVNSPVNTLVYEQTPAVWNNNATNAGDSSVLYISGIIDLTHADLVYTVPPTETPFTVTQFFDDFINVFANPGTRTTYTPNATSYLLVGPNSRYAHKKTVKIKGHTYPVIASPTNHCEMLVRVLADTLVPPSDASSPANTYKNVALKFALNSLRQFQRNGNAPVYPANYTPYSPSAADVRRAAKWQNTPTNAVEFFKQVGASLRHNPLPTRRTGLGGTLLTDLPSYIAPQPNAVDRYYPASAGQQGALDLFRPIGLTATGWHKPRGWGQAELDAMQAGMNAGAAYIQAQLQTPPGASTNYWGYVNSNFGAYANTVAGYTWRAVGVIAGGFPNIPIDGLYAVQFANGGGGALDGNNTYSITFTPPAAPGAPLPVVGTLPPLAMNGNVPYGFWSITLYQPDEKQASAPFLSQASVLNTAYSSADTAVVSVDAANDTVTVAPSAVGSIGASTPIIFDSGATSYGLTPGTVYYVAGTPTVSGGNLTFQLSTQWKQALSVDGVPIQAAPVGTYGGQPGAIANLTSGAGTVQYGMVQPVSQLGSSEIDGGSVVPNNDGSYTIWFAPTLPDGVDPHNWIPTPSTEYLQSIYGNVTLDTTIEPMIRMYDAQPGNQPPSILPCPAGIQACDNGNGLPSSYLFPPLVQVS